MDGAIVISFGPFWDIWFRIALVVTVFAGSAITLQYLEVEIRSWFPKKDKDEFVAQSSDLKLSDFEKDERDPENDELVEYATADVELTRETFATPHFEVKSDGSIQNNFPKINLSQETRESLEASVKGWNPAIFPEPLAVDAVSAYPDVFMQWSASALFDEPPAKYTMKTSTPENTMLEMLEINGPGHIRWRYAGQENWHEEGYLSKNLAHRMLNKETADGKA